MRGLTLNVLAAMPLGLLIAELLSLESGNWIAMVMLFPMLLARYAWLVPGLPKATGSR